MEILLNKKEDKMRKAGSCNAKFCKNVHVQFKVVIQLGGIFIAVDEWYLYTYI